MKAETGELAWYYQAVPGDEWDYDNVQQLTLADITINGRLRRVNMQATKGGIFYVLDRTTGEFISAAPFARDRLGRRHGPPITYEIDGKQYVALMGNPAGAGARGAGGDASPGRRQ